MSEIIFIRPFCLDSRFKAVRKFLFKLTYFFRIPGCVGHAGVPGGRGALAMPVAARRARASARVLVRAESGQGTFRTV